jgi:hypothetical protein
MGWLKKYQTGGAIKGALKPQYKKALDGKGPSFERKVNTLLGDPQGKARKDAENKSGDGDEEIDNIRHASAGRYTAEAIANKTGNIPYVSKPLGMIGANLMGIGHELGTYFTDPRWKDKDWKVSNLEKAKVITREALEDSYNNFMGSVVGTTDMTPEQKTARIKQLSQKYQIPDGYGMLHPYEDNPTFVDPYSKKQYGGPSSSNVASKTKNRLSNTDSDFENYGRIINQYQGRPNDTSYMYTRNSMRGNSPYTEQIFYNTGQNAPGGMPVSNVNRGQYVGQIPSDSVSYWRNMVDAQLPYKKDGGYSTTGYKADSPDRHNPYNIIPSGRITMQNVPHPVLGIDNLGNRQMMKPGGEYQFQGDQVFEVPAMKEGGMIKRADGSYSKRGLWDNIRANAGSGKKPTKEMLQQEKKIRGAEKKEYGGWLNQYQNGGWKADPTATISPVPVQGKTAPVMPRPQDGIPRTMTPQEIAELERTENPIRKKIRTFDAQDLVPKSALHPENQLLGTVGDMVAYPIKAINSLTDPQHNYTGTPESNMLQYAMDVDAAVPVMTGIAKAASPYIKEGINVVGKAGKFAGTLLNRAAENQPKPNLNPVDEAYNNFLAQVRFQNKEIANHFNRTRGDQHLLVNTRRRDLQPIFEQYQNEFNDIVSERSNIINNRQQLSLEEIVLARQRLRERDADIRSRTIQEIMSSVPEQRVRPVQPVIKTQESQSLNGWPTDPAELTALNSRYGSMREQSINVPPAAPVYQNDPDWVQRWSNSVSQSFQQQPINVEPIKPTEDILKEIGVSKEDVDMFKKHLDKDKSSPGTLNYAGRLNDNIHIKDKSILENTEDIPKQIKLYENIKSQLDPTNRDHTKLLSKINTNLSDLYATDWLRNSFQEELKLEGKIPTKKNLSIHTMGSGTKYLIDENGKVLGNISGIDPSKPRVGTAAVLEEHHAANDPHNNISDALYRGINKGLMKAYNTNLETSKNFAATEFFNPKTGQVEILKRAKNYWESRLKPRKGLGNLPAAEETPSGNIRMIRGLAPYIGVGALGTGAASQADNQKYGGWLKKYQNGGLATISPVSTTGTSIGTSTISGTPTINKNLLQLRQWDNQSKNVETSIAPNPAYRNKLVQDQVDYVMQNRAKNDTLPFAVVDKKSNNIAYYDRYGKIKGFEPVITGADNKDVDVAPSMKEFNAMYNVKGNKDYFNYLKATGQKITPAGIYTAHLRENQLDEPGNRAVHYVKNLLNPSREEEVKAHRVQAYGPQNKIFTLTDESGRGISKAIHGTGYDERIEALNNPNIRNKDLSNGCINVGGKTICFDALRSNSKVYILPEETDNIVKYKPASTTSKVVPQAIAKKKQGGWLQKY